MRKVTITPWFKVDENYPVEGLKVIATYIHKAIGEPRIVIAHRIPENFAECHCEYDCDCTYDDKTDNYYYPAGWYEQTENWDEFSCIRVSDGEITHWMPLPELPKCCG